MAFVGMRWLLKQAVNIAGIGENTTAANVCNLWDKVIAEKFGENFKKKTKAMKFKDGILEVRAESPAFAQELELSKQEIIDEINRKDGQNILFRIRFVA